MSGGSGHGRRRGHEEEHEEHENHERWLVSYADMMTLLMVLFIVMFAISQVDQRKFMALKTGLAAGFGAPVAVSGAMLAGLGFDPFFAAGMCLLANTAPVAFGSIGIPVITLANVTGLPVLALSAMVGRLCAMMSVVIPGYLIVVMAGPARALEVLPAIIACGDMGPACM